MILGIFNNIWKWLNGLSDDLYDFVMRNYEQPFFWVIIFGILLLICLWTINQFANK